MGGDIKHDLVGVEERSGLILTFEGKGNEVIDELPFLEIQGMRLHLSLSPLGNGE